MTAPLRLCVFTAFGDRLGGSDNILWTFLRNLDSSRIDPLVVFLGPGRFEREVAGIGLRTGVLPEGRLRNPAHAIGQARRAAGLLRREEPDLILNWLSTAHLLAGPGAVLAGMADRCLWWQLDLHTGRSHAGATVPDRLATARGRLLDQLAALVPAKAIGACSQAAADAQARIRPRRPAFAVLPGIDEPPRASDSERAQLRSRLGIEETKTVVGMTGRLFAWKGQHLLLRALAELRGAGHAVHGLFVGGGGHRGDDRYERQLRSLVDELGLASSVTFTGQVPEATPYTEVMDVFVNASSPEPFGLVVLEAMALGVPVVAVRSGGPAEILEPGVLGILVESNRPSDLAAGVGRLLGDSGLRERLALAARARYEECFTGTEMTRRMEERLLELAS
jgi:glycosyltransferase involved in cell wall biosynthesis